MRRIRNFIQGGGGGVQVRRPENSLDNVCFFFRGGPMVLLQRKLYFSKDPEGVQFSRGRGSNFFLMLISKETHITCDFPGDPDPLSPLWIRTCLRM